ncbi:MAG: serine peptidase [Candidatus Contendobacter odensis]|uniref:Probable periplasmic serine endoprotease DegP-like n=1 Tax=Candidatus Contendibacter odensensis TaxID=1400860 RepID=A0A2G6PDZ0_9GAMM|nr:MAG: serine peptidase [Candidatus Contendobacter odensis]
MLLLCIPLCSIADKPDPLIATRSLPDFRRLVKQNEPAVVNISSTETSNRRSRLGLPELPGNENPYIEFFRRFFQERPELPGDRQSNSLGSGFIISKDGYILTNAHVARDIDKIIVRLSDQRERPAKVIGVDELADVALLKIKGKNLPTVKIGDSDKLEVGEWVMAIGSPFGLERTATQGIVSAVGRNLPSGTYVPFIQSDVAVNPGSSGGPLFNLRGEVVGMNSQIYSSTGGYMGLSFAIPIKLAMQVVEQLKSTGEVTRGWLGVLLQQVNNDLAEAFKLDRPRGALVAQILPDSPAASAGFKQGDIILRYGGQPIEDSSQLPRMIGVTPVGKTIAMSVLRNGEPLEIRATITRLEAKDESVTTMDEHSALHLNIVVADLSNEQRRNIGAEDTGVLVTRINPGPAANAGLYPDDIILQINHMPIKSAAHFVELVKALPAGQIVPMLVQRETEALYLAVHAPEK